MWPFRTRPRPLLDPQARLRVIAGLSDEECWSALDHLGRWGSVENAREVLESLAVRRDRAVDDALKSVLEARTLQQPVTAKAGERR
ncbi:MAG: hypothetical protein JWL97_4513 [Gemmatimonadales bacterium]|nr:hypothetical protein [Gemmatimonadales bacterium]